MLYSSAYNAFYYSHNYASTLALTPSSNHYLAGAESGTSDVTSTEEYNFLYCTLR